MNGPGSVSHTRTRTVLLTGATGLLGSALLWRLLKRGHSVLVLGRRRASLAPADRIERVLSFQGVRAGAYSGKLDVLDDEALKGQAGSRALGRIDTVVHAAAAVKFDSDFADLVEQNCGATKRLIRLLDEHAPGAHFHFVSTAYVHGRGSGVATECLAPSTGDSRHPYELTKSWGERLVVELSQKSDRPFTIFRPSIIAGDSRSGLAANFNGVYSLLRLVDEIGRHRLRGESAVIECDPEGTKNIVSVDWVARAIVEMAERGAASSVYHLTHPRPVGHRDLLAMLGRLTGVAGLEVAETARGSRRRTRLQRLVDRSLRPFAPYLWDEPEFDRSNLERDLSDLASPPPVDEGYLQRLIEFGRRVRWTERPLEMRQPSSQPLSA